MIQRRTPLKRSTKPIKRSPIKRKARKRRNTDDPAHLERIRGLPCIVCLDLGRHQRTGTVAHHIKDGHGSCKASDRETIPLCTTHHTTGVWSYALRLAGKGIWEERYGTQKELLARTLYAAGFLST